MRRPPLAGGSELLVLDNAEHLPGADDQVRRLLAEAPGIRILVTSVSPLGLLGEQVLRLGPLGRSARPDADAGGHDSYAVYVEDAGAAVRLFEERARTVVVGFRLDAQAAAAVANLMDAITAFLTDAITSPFMPLIVFAVCLIDGFFPPIPSETTVLAAAAFTLASEADHGAILAILVARTLGAAFGDSTGYSIGRWLGAERFAWMRRPPVRRATAWAARQIDKRPTTSSRALRRRDRPRHPQASPRPHPHRPRGHRPQARHRA